MTRTEYIEKLVRFAKMKWKLTDLEEEEIRLALEMIPDRNGEFIPQLPINPTINPEPKFPTTAPRNPFPPTVTMYGCPTPWELYFTTSWSSPNGTGDNKNKGEK